MINFNYKYEEIFNNIKNYIQKYYPSTKVIKHRNIKLQYPCIVVEENSNILGSMTKDSYGAEHIRELSYEVTIYAIDDVTNQKTSFEICDELSQMVLELMQQHYRMQGGVDAKIPFINDQNATQYTLHFSCQWYMNKNKVY